MKSFTLLFGTLWLLVSAAMLSAQTAPSLNSSAFWRAGNSYTLAYATQASGAQVSVGAAGANRTWNLAGLVSEGEYTENLIAAAGTAFAANFPNATLATDDGDGCFSYYNVGANGVFYLGYSCGTLNYSTASGDGLPEVLTGLAYNAQRTGTTTFTGVDPDFPIPYSTTVNYTIIYDAWGTLTLPGNRVFPQTARLFFAYSVEGESDTGYVFVNTVNGEIIAYYYGSGQWDFSTTATPGATSRLEPWAHSPARVYPNPVQDVLTVQVPGLASNGTVELAMINLTGQVLGCEEQPAADVLHLPVGQLPTGLYHLRIRTGNQETFVKVVKQ